MKNGQDKFLADKIRVLEWMEKYCKGVRCARHRADILPFVQLPDRYWRQIISDLVDEGIIYSSSTRGYWWALLHTNDHYEIDAMKHAILERKAKALSMIEGCDKRLKEVMANSQGQLEMSI